MDDSDDFLNSLLETFKVEAEEHLKAISDGLLSLERSPAAGPEVIEAVYRGAHSLKGAARAVNLEDIETVCQALESVFNAVKHDQLRLGPRVFDTLYAAVDTVRALLAPDAGASASRVAQLLNDLASLAGGEPAAAAAAQEEPAPAPPAEKEPAAAESPPRGESPALPETVRMATAKIEAIFLEAEEMIAFKQTARQRADDLRDAAALFERWRREWAKARPHARSLRQSLEAGDERSPARQVLEFLDWNEAFLKELETRAAAEAAAGEAHYRAIASQLDPFLEDAKKLLMLPFSTLLHLFPRLVRELSRELGKEAELTIEGEDIEVDRRILEGLKDPLIHLVRNCIDHGIEAPSERRSRGKPERGAVAISISQMEGDRVEVVVADDGRGIDPDRVRLAAAKRGLISPQEAEALSDAETISLIFESEVSTSPTVTNLSGRGLGMAIVKEAVEKLGGSVWVENRPGAGAAFHLRLPVTVATFRGILVGAAGRTFVTPTARVERVVRVPAEEIQSVKNRPVLPWDGRAVPLVRLADVLELESDADDDRGRSNVIALVISSAGQRVAFEVDEVLGEQEILVKTLGWPLRRVRNLAGATVLGSGEVAPILNAADLIKSATRTASTKRRPASQERPEPKAILVAEDSITSRTLLKNILQSAGYQVETAVDGLDALTRLKTGRFHLVVSDVEMPRMDGFALTEAIRASREFSDLPVVLVTGLASREDRERGVDAGADAYIVKSRFDQSDLLEVVQRLI